MQKRHGGVQAAFGGDIAIAPHLFCAKLYVLGYQWIELELSGAQQSTNDELQSNLFMINVGRGLFSKHYFV